MIFVVVLGLSLNTNITSEYFISNIQIHQLLKITTPKIAQISNST